MWAGIGAVVLVVAALVPVLNGWVRDDGQPLARLPRPLAADPDAATPTPTALPSRPGSDSASGAGAEATPEYSLTSVVVSLRDPQDVSAVTSRGATVVGEITGTDFLVVRPAGDPVDLVEALAQDPDVVAVSLDYGRRKLATPSDPLYGSNQQAYLNMIRMPQAWDLRTEAASQVVAVLDTGVDTSHPDLAGRLVPGYNAVSPGEPVTDPDGHGTFVAGVIAARANNGTGIAGVVWDGRVMPVDVFVGELAFDSHIAQGIVWAVDHGASVINLSLGGPGVSPLLHAAVRYATSRNVVVVAASGNDGNDVVQYPAAFPEVLAVGATDSAGRLVDFSSFGDWVDLAAPGFTVASTFPGGSYAIGDGTSFSAPMVSGVAALVRAQNPALTAAQVGDRLRAAARDAGPRGIDPYYGWGVLDAARALGAPVADDLPFPDLGADEPNDVPERAVVLPFGATPTDSIIAVEGDVDWYRVNVPAGQQLMVTVTPPAFDPARGQNVDPVLEVYNTELERIAYADSPDPSAVETVNVFADSASIYIKVSNYNGSADSRRYDLRITGSTQLPLTVERVALPDGLSPASGVQTGDVTGDGIVDVVVTAWDVHPALENWIVVYAGRADGTLASPVAYKSTDIYVRRAVILDIDQDGLLDVAAAGSRKIEAFTQQPDGTLRATGEIPTALGFGTATTAVVAGDIDGDGDTDLVTSHGAVYLIIHGEGSSFSLSKLSDDVAFDLAVGDVDGDGRNDVVVGRNPPIVYHNRADGWEATTTDNFEIYGQATIDTGDLTGDGRQDVVVVAEGLSAKSLVHVYAQRLDGTLAPRVTYSGNDPPWSHALGDLDGDGLTDVAHIGGARAVVFYQQPDGTLGPPATTDVSSFDGMDRFAQNSLAMVDLDDDGRNELVVATSPLMILRHQTASDGSAGLVRSVSPVEYSTGASLSTAPQVVFASDVDGATVNGDTVRLVDGRTGAAVAGSVSYNAGSRTATFTPAATLHRAKPYRIVVDGVLTVDGSPVEPFASTFTTTGSGPLPALADFAVLGQHGSAAVVTATVPIGDVGEVIVRYASGSTPPSSPTAGSAGYAGAAGGVTVGGLTPGQTYSFAVWYRDRAGNLSPRSTATLIGTTLTLTSGTSGGGFMTFIGTVSTPAGPGVGVPVPLVAVCPGPVQTTTVATATGGAGGQLSLTVPLGSPRCTYRWEINNSSAYMGGFTESVQVRPDVPPRRD